MARLPVHGRDERCPACRQTVMTDAGRKLIGHAVATNERRLVRCVGSGLTAQEVAEALTGEQCVVCGLPATTSYPRDEDGAASCGRPGCELRMQAAMDYHEERGG